MATMDMLPPSDVEAPLPPPVSSAESMNQNNDMPSPAAATSQQTMRRSLQSAHSGDSLSDTDGHLEANRLNKTAKALKEIARKEDRAVLWLRGLVMVLLLLVATLVSVGVYFYTVGAETNQFEDSVATYAAILQESFGDAVERKLGALGTLSNTITGYAQDTNSNFPFVSVSDFAVRGSDVRVLADALVIHWAPLVTEDQRLDWETYAFENRFLIDDAYEQDTQLAKEQDDYFAGLLLIGSEEEPTEPTELSGSNYGQRRTVELDVISAPPSTAVEPNNDTEKPLESAGLSFVEPHDAVIDSTPNLLDDGTGYRPRIWDPTNDRQAEPDGSGPYWPSWQRTPVNRGKQGLINLNFNSAKVMKGMMSVLEKMDDPKVIINRISVPLPSFHKEVTANIQASQYRNQLDKYLEDPISFFAYPVFDSFNTTTRELAGALVSNLYWRVYFQNILPPVAKGFICVLENSYNQTVSYRVDGADVTFLGPEDFHDKKYDDMETKVDVTPYVQSRANPQTRAYLTVPLHDSVGLYTLRVYPSQATEDVYRSNKPAVYLAAVACIFVFTTLVFLLFDRWVEKRNKVVMDRAIQSGTIVNNLFPEQVQERLFKANAGIENESADKATPWKKLSQTLANESKESKVSTVENKKSERIADYFEESTIMFADIAGFTKWSAARSPSQIFDLLETLYGAMDRIALRRRVFKVETIGDCWLGICGAPNPNVKHAVVMTRFACDCLKKMEEITVQLQDELGSDTTLLKLRVGLHSGPVTAGVLAGQKSRFQLFGDSVNTASRIESLGKPGRIHVSSATANQLIAHGKQAWLVEREDLVEAKGKGTLQTYWVDEEKLEHGAGSNGSLGGISMGSASLADLLADLPG